MFHQFDIDRDRVTIDGQVVVRPPYCSVSEWDEFWERARGKRPLYQTIAEANNAWRQARNEGRLP